MPAHLTIRVLSYFWRFENSPKEIKEEQEKVTAESKRLRQRRTSEDEHFGDE
jgi:hypothetical protein